MKNNGGSEDQDQLDLVHEAYEFEKIQQSDKAQLLEKGRSFLSKHRRNISKHAEQEIEASLSTTTFLFILTYKYKAILLQKFLQRLKRKL